MRISVQRSTDHPPEPVPWWDDDAEANADMWATAEESRDAVLGLYHRACAHSDRTIAELALSETGHVPWWPTAEQHPTLHTLMITVVVETARHAGHADVLREQIDGRVGLRAGHTNVPSADAEWWESYRQRLEDIATAFD